VCRVRAPDQQCRRDARGACTAQATSTDFTLD
jgi:hypothetical protein